MGTRADFYIRKREDEKTIMEYLGSVAFDGYPEGFSNQAGITALTSHNEAEFKAAVLEILNSRDDASLPEKHGWPWPWNDSLLTDFAYVFDGGDVHGFCFGRPFDLQKRLSDGDSDNDLEEEETDKIGGYFPDMAGIKNVDYERRSGLIVISV